MGGRITRAPLRGRWGGALVAAVAVLCVCSCRGDNKSPNAGVDADLNTVAAAYRDFHSCLRQGTSGKTMWDALRRRLVLEGAAGKYVQQCGQRFSQRVDKRIHDGVRVRERWKQPGLARLRKALTSLTSFANEANWAIVPNLCSDVSDVDAALRRALTAAKLGAELPDPVRCTRSQPDVEALRAPQVLMKQSVGVSTAVRRVGPNGVLIAAFPTSDKLEISGDSTERLLIRTTDGVYWELLPLPSLRNNRTHIWSGSIAWAADAVSPGTVRLRVIDYRCPGPSCNAAWVDAKGRKLRVHRLASWRIAATVRGAGAPEAVIANGSTAALITTKNGRHLVHLVTKAGKHVAKPVPLPPGGLHYMLGPSGAVTALRVQSQGAEAQVMSHHLAPGATAPTTTVLKLPSRLSAASARSCSDGSAHWALVGFTQLIASADDGKSWRLVGNVGSKSPNFPSLRCAGRHAYFLFMADSHIQRLRCTTTTCDAPQRLGAGIRPMFSARDVDTVLVDLASHGAYVLDTSAKPPVVKELVRIRDAPAMTRVRVWRVAGHVFARPL